MSQPMFTPYVRYAGKVACFGQKNGFSMAYDCRIFMALTGNGSIIVENMEYQLHKYDVVFLPPATPYRFVANPRIDLWSMNFDFSQEHIGDGRAYAPVTENMFQKNKVTEFPPAPFDAPLVYRGMKVLDAVLEKIVREADFPRAMSLEMASLLLSECLIELMRYESRSFSKDQNTVRRLVRYIEEHCTEEISNAQIAAQFALHPYYLNRIFKKNTGETMHSYLMRARIRLACGMVLAGDKSISEIAEESGFCNQAHFAKVFRAYTGMTPTAYRNSSPVL